jgi:hypothetical protein
MTRQQGGMNELHQPSDEDEEEGEQDDEEHRITQFRVEQEWRRENERSMTGASLSSLGNHSSFIFSAQLLYSQTEQREKE